jgi:Ca-activated chloride channel family protein
MNQFHFLRPFWLLALIPCVLLLLLLWKRARTQSAWNAVVDPQFLPFVLETTQKNAGRKRALLLCSLAWFIAVIALAGPCFQQALQTVYRQIQARVIAVDLSPTMLADDLSPSRMDRAKYKIIDLLRQTKQGQVGMVAFSDTAYVVSPLTDDAATLLALTPDLSPDIMPTHGSDISSGLQEAVQLLKHTAVTSGNIILLTASLATPNDIKVARAIHAQGYTVSVLAVATEKGALIPETTTVSTLDAQGLSALAKAGGGEYLTLSQDNHDIQRLMTLGAPDTSKTESLDTPIIYWQDQAYYLLWGLLPLVLIFRRGWLERI